MYIDRLVLLKSRILYTAGGRFIIATICQSPERTDLSIIILCYFQECRVVFASLKYDLDIDIYS